LKLKQAPTGTPSAAGPSPTPAGARSVAGWLRSLGPGIITAALVFGPGSLTITSRLGALYGFALLWVVVVAAGFMLVFTAMAARIGLASEESLLGLIRQKWGQPAAVGIGLGVFLVTASFQAGNTIGASIAFAELFGTSPTPWILTFTLLAIGLLFVRAFYQVLEKIMLVLVGLMLVAFLTTLVLAQPSLSGILSGFAPTIPDGSQLLVIALVASSFSIVGAFYQAYLVQERRRIRPQGQASPKDSFVGIIILGLIGSVVLASAATVLHPRGLQVNSATDMARALEPIFGDGAAMLFMGGLFGASFSSLIGNATIGGSLLGDALGLGSQLRALPVRVLIALVMVFGAAIALAFGRLPLELIIFAQGITILIVPFIGWGIYAVANDRHLMGPLTNRMPGKVLGALGLAVLLLLAMGNVKGLFF
jgi:manganese transport protein